MLQAGLTSLPLASRLTDLGVRSSATLWTPCSPCSTSNRTGRHCCALRAVPQPLAVDTSGTVPSPPAATRPQRQRRSRIRQEDPEEDEDPVKYPSTWGHRAWTWGSIGLLAAAAVSGSTRVSGTPSAAAAVVSLVVAYYLSDFLTGVYHWSVDNYGDGNTPIVGEQIAAFQGHHGEPWTITERAFCNNVHKVFKPAAFFGALVLAASPWLPGWLGIGLATTTGLVCMSQQCHAWAHMKKSQLPGNVVALQEAGLLVSRRQHGAHHMAPFEGNYCIVSGFWNSILDDSNFFRHLEQIVYDRTGVEPRCWQPADSPLFKR